MSTATIVFLLIGGLGTAVLAVALLGGELLHLGDPDIDGPISLEMITGFIGAFGFGAAIVHEVLGAGSTTAVAMAATAGAAAALPVAYVATKLSRAARRMHTDATPTRSDLIGALGVVVTPIRAGGYGEIRVRLGGQPVKLYARADAAIPIGTQVFVVEAPTETSVVVEPTRSVAG